MTAPHWAACPYLRRDLQAVEHEAAARISAAGPLARDVHLPMLRAGGKRLRPALTLLAGRFGRAPRDRLIRAAAAVELFHMATLYHDDLVDGARRRRGAPVLHRRRGSRTAALAGSHLFHLAHWLVADAGDEVARRVGVAARDLCNGQVSELERQGDWNVSVADRFEIMEQKTASLFELAAALGGLLARAEASVLQALCRYARALGTAFQIADDIVDLFGKPSTLGREPGADLCNGIATLPVILALEADCAESRELGRLLASSDGFLHRRDVSRAAELTWAAGGLTGAEAAARAHAERACLALDELPGSPAKTALIDMAKACLDHPSIAWAQRPAMSAHEMEAQR